MGVARLWESILAHVGKVAPSLAALGDWLRPANHLGWGGPFNAQRERQRLFREIVRLLPVAAIIETGTHRGTTTEFLWHVSGAPVWTTEYMPRFAAFAGWRFAGIEDVTIAREDSRAFLRRLAADATVPKQNVFFYLDAHWGEDLPLCEELKTIDEYWTESVVMIDDFQVAHDPGYGFDDYGPGKALTIGLLPEQLLDGWDVFYPAAHSSRETGARRGSVIIVAKTQSPLLREAALRQAFVA
jgi:hypothetical protein